MIKSIQIKDFIVKRYPYSILLLFCFPLLKENLSSLAFLIFGLLTIAVKFGFSKGEKLNKKILVFTIPFWIILLDAFLYGRLKESGSAINHALLFLLFPVVFYLAPSYLFTKEKLHRYFNLLTWVCVILGVSYLLLFVLNKPVSSLIETKYNSSLFRDFVYSETKIFSIHPAYYTSIVIFCMAYQLKNNTINPKIINSIILLFLYVITFLMLTKLNIVVMNLILIVYILFHTTISRIKKTAFILLIVISIILSLFYVPGLYIRFVEIFTSFGINPTGVAHDSTNIRVAIYTCDWEIIKNNLWQGIGFYDIQNQLLNCFESKYHSSFYENHKYLSHNYFLYILLGSGIVGFTGFLYFCYRVVNFALKINSFVFYVFILNTFLMCCIEDYFYRQNGIYFFMLIFLCYFKYFDSVKAKKIENI
ncbi:O-antigen ligase family protein [Flavobacterium sp.]|uniref:O-antigen ligase family protein n=1 Tax=Flavobacterium sp. TaxID=239 RepID=UPI002FDAE2B8